MIVLEGTLGTPSYGLCAFGLEPAWAKELWAPAEVCPALGAACAGCSVCLTVRERRSYRLILCCFTGHEVATPVKRKLDGGDGASAEKRPRLVAEPGKSVD